MDTSNVDTVFIAGQVRKWRGALVGHDLAALRREMDRARDALFARAKRGSALFGSCCAP